MDAPSITVYDASGKRASRRPRSMLWASSISSSPICQSCASGRFDVRSAMTCYRDRRACDEPAWPGTSDVVCCSGRLARLAAVNASGAARALREATSKHHADERSADACITRTAIIAFWPKPANAPGHNDDGCARIDSDDTVPFEACESLACRWAQKRLLDHMRRLSANLQKTSSAKRATASARTADLKGVTQSPDLNVREACPLRAR